MMPRPNKNYEPQKRTLAKLAFDLFVREGYENVTITQIMNAAGLTKAGMYHYYDSKEKILDAAIDYGLHMYLENIKKDMCNMRFEEKLLYFIRGNTESNELMDKILLIKKTAHDSYAAYRIREKMVHKQIPIMENILQEGIEKGVYKCDYPQEAAEFGVLLVRAIVEPNIFPQASPDKMLSRMNVYLKLMEVLLKPTADHAEDIIEVFNEELQKIIKEHKGEVD